MKPGKRKIMVQICGAVLDALNKEFRRLHIKRDSYLNDLLTNEIELLNDEVKFRNRDEVAKLIRERPLSDRKKFTLELDETLINRMSDVLNDKNIFRDSFINRVFFFLIARDRHLTKLGIEYDRDNRIEGNPLDDASWFMGNPFDPIRTMNNGRFYTIHCFPDRVIWRNFPNLFGLNTAICDADWELMNTELDDPPSFALTANKESGNGSN